jgi:ribulose-phosphate 3-epimerase
MSRIVPAILPTSEQDLSSKLERLSGIAKEVQIDLVDGRFVSPASWPYTTSGSHDPCQALGTDMLPYLGQLRYEMDLMVEDPAAVAGAWIEAGATRIIAHAESTRFLGKFVEDMKRTYGHDKSFAPDLLSFGLALNVASPISLIEPFLADIDFVQFMGIRKIGKQGEPFDRAVIQKILSFRKKYPDMSIQVDGGVSLQTAPDLLEAGVSRLVIGSALWRAVDLPLEIARYEALTITHGRYE